MAKKGYLEYVKECRQLLKDAEVWLGNERSEHFYRDDDRGDAFEDWQYAYFGLTIKGRKFHKDNFAVKAIDDTYCNLIAVWHNSGCYYVSEMVPTTREMREDWEKGMRYLDEEERHEKG